MPKQDAHGMRESLRGEGIVPRPSQVGQQPVSSQTSHVFSVFSAMIPASLSGRDGLNARRNHNEKRRPVVGSVRPIMPRPALNANAATGCHLADRAEMRLCDVEGGSRA